MIKTNNTTDIKKIVLKLKPLPVKNYENIDLDRLVIYTLSLLEKEKIPLYFDFISVGLFRLFPRKFALANFKQYPDTFRVNNAIRRTTGSLSERKQERWANGSPENGFSLTDLGREIAKQVIDRLNHPELDKKAKRSAVSKSRGRSYNDDVREIRESDAFIKWTREEEVNSHEFFAFLRAASYTPRALLVDHLNKLKVSAAAAKDDEVIKFLNWLGAKFRNLL